jgi:hypothetical protein
MKKLIAAVVALGALVKFAGRDIKRYIEMRRM